MNKLNLLLLKLLVSFSLILSSVFYVTASYSQNKGAYKNNRVVFLDGYVVHGVNVFNNEYLVDYSKVSPNIPFLMPFPPLYEIGVFDDGATNSETITASTNQKRRVATNSRFAELFGLPIDTSLYNITLDKVTSNFFGSTAINDRIPLLSFREAGEASVYRRIGTVPSPTLKQWNRIIGQVKFRCLNDDRAIVRVQIANAFPNAVYTMWDVGALDPLTPSERPYGVPLGGSPNILQTDDFGCASTTLKVPYCPGRPCEAGAKSCSSYLSVAQHWDQQTYGASPAASFAGIPIGAFTGNHMVWPVSGETLQEPHKAWDVKKASRICRRKML